MKSIEIVKAFLLLCLVLISGYAVFIYHSQRYEVVTAVDKLYLIDKRTGATYYPVAEKGEVKWRKWVSGK